MTPEQLKASILQYAMEGKLVKQDTNDEPASILLEKIKAEKEKLVKEGKIKKSKKLPAIEEDEKSFDIPDSWEWVRLEDVCDYIQRGKSPKYDKANKNYPIISQKCNQWSGISLEYAKFLAKEFWNSLEEYRFVRQEDVLLNSTGLGTVGRVCLLAKSFNKVPVDSHVTIIRHNHFMTGKYIYYFMMSPLIQSNLKNYLSGSTKQKEFSRNTVINLVLPLPPLAEQKRIVAEIEKLMPLVGKYAEAYNRLQKIDGEFKDKLKQTILQYAMEGKLVKQNPNDEPVSILLEKIKAEKEKLVKEGKIKKSKKLPAIEEDEKPFDVPNSWEWLRLVDIGDWGAGGTPSRQHPEYYNGDILWLKTGDLTDGVINDTSEKITEVGVRNSSLKINRPGNVLIAMYGATIGKLGIVGKTLVTNQACCGCTPFSGMYNWYLFYYLLSARKRLIELGSGGAQPNISKTKIEHFLIPLPPLAEQKRIVAKIDRMMIQIDEIQ